LSSGTLPGGLTFSQSGLIGGTPFVVGTFDLTVTATDSANAVAVGKGRIVVRTQTEDDALRRAALMTIIQQLLLDD